jgi:hypothetical protein
MKNKSIVFFCICCLIATKFYGQQKPSTSINVRYEKNSTNDSVWISVSTPITTKPGTLMLVTTASNTVQADTAFFPIVDTASEFILLIPQEYRASTLHVKGLFYPRIFTVTGKVLNKVKNKAINVMLITTGSQKIYNKELKLSDDNEFALPGLVFEKKASVIFSYTSDKKTDHPDVSIQQAPSAKSFTDSVFFANIPLFVPVANANNTPVNKTLPVNNSFIPSSDSTDKKVKLLNSVTVVGKRKTNAQKFNETYSSPMYSDINEKVIDCLDNNNILSYPDCLSYIRSQIPGLRPEIDKFGESILIWRGHETKAFFIDEIAVDIDQLLAVNVADIAIIKAFPPPFFGSLGTGDGGAIAIYTRRGEYRTANTSYNKWLYSIKGYSPAIHTLFSGRN